MLQRFFSIFPDSGRVSNNNCFTPNFDEKNNYIVGNVFTTITVKKFGCEKCGRRYSYNQGLKQHQKYECGKEPKFKCPICQRKFYQRGNMKSHIITVHNQSYRITEHNQLN